MFQLSGNSILPCHLGNFEQDDICSCHYFSKIVIFITIYTTIFFGYMTIFFSWIFASISPTPTHAWSINFVRASIFPPMVVIMSDTAWWIIYQLHTMEYCSGKLVINPTDMAWFSRSTWQLTSIDFNFYMIQSGLFLARSVINRIWTHKALYIALLAKVWYV